MSSGIRSYNGCGMDGPEVSTYNLIGHLLLYCGNVSIPARAALLTTGRALVDCPR